MRQPLGSIVQTAYVVDDLTISMNRWLQTGLTGPFFLLEHLELDQPTYRNQPTQLDMSIALAYSGGVCVELIQQHNNVPSVYNEQPTGLGSTHHHVAMMTENFDQQQQRYVELGHEIVFAGAVAVGGRFSYVDTHAALGCLVELIELTPVVAELFTAIEQSAVNWNGEDPIRTM